MKLSKILIGMLLITGCNKPIDNGCITKLLLKDPNRLLGVMSTMKDNEFEKFSLNPNKMYFQLRD